MLVAIYLDRSTVTNAGHRALVLGDLFGDLDGGSDLPRTISVGLPIVAPGPERDLLSVAPRGWVDLRPEQFGVWIKRAGAMVRDADARAAGRQSSGTDLDWNVIPDDPIEPSRFATWVFTVEEKGARIKR